MPFRRSDLAPGPVDLGCRFGPDDDIGDILAAAASGTPAAGLGEPGQTPHSWHQDAGIAQPTVLLGFPPRDKYVGGGVFSHHVKLSHPLRPSAGDTHGAVVEYERLGGEPIPDEFVMRPLYSKGREVWVSDDAAHLHSTPDRQNREALWRFM